MNVPRCFGHRRLIPLLWKQHVVTRWCPCLMEANWTHLASLRYRFLAKKVANAKTFVTPERLPPTTSATNLHSRRTYLQVMERLGKNYGMQPTEWGWAVQWDKLVPLVMKDSPAPNSLLKMVHCNCSAGCSTMRCGCRKHALVCTRACGNCQDGDCDNMAYKPVSDDDEDEA